jgi:hypothetical protein
MPLHKSSRNNRCRFLYPTVDFAQTVAEDSVAQTRWIVRIAIGFAYQQLIAHGGVMWVGARNVDFPTAGMAWYALTAETRRMYDVMSDSQR